MSARDLRERAALARAIRCNTPSTAGGAWPRGRADPVTPLTTLAGERLPCNSVNEAVRDYDQNSLRTRTARHGELHALCAKQQGAAAALQAALKRARGLTACHCYA